MEYYLIFPWKLFKYFIHGIPFSSLSSIHISIKSEVLLVKCRIVLPNCLGAHVFYTQTESHNPIQSHRIGSHCQTMVV